jgi:hypothetical protein
MASWATKRKFAYTLLFVGFLILVVGIPGFLFLYEQPTCFDGMQNQNEQGIDCGGKCVRVCSSAFLSPIVVWSRATEVESGIYNLLAYIENPNLDGVAYGVPYVFKLYDKQGILIGEREGYANLPPHKNVPIFEPSMLTDKRIPATVTFEFKDFPAWEKNTEQEPDVIVVEKTLIDHETLPKITAIIQNRTVKPVSNIEAVAVVFDINDNALAFSQTFVDKLPAQGTERLAFTWPKPFKDAPARVEVILTILKK